MEVKLYKSYGVLAHEGFPVYTQHTPASDIYDLVTVTIPDAIGVNEAGDVLVDIKGTTYMLSEVLSNYKDAPALRWYDGHYTHHKILREV